MCILFGNHLWTLAFHALFVTESRALGGLNRSSEGFRSFEEKMAAEEKKNITQIDLHRFPNIIINIISKHVLSPCFCFYNPATRLIVQNSHPTQ